ncbi:dbp [Spodoptera frugiperda granulovirus]|uniref:Dbp n=1 Tax=Spodoptera frugiperda granulovirus TaxID=307454 RepID=A0A0C5B343_9BBAC|nr:dbp [Spodoptera frugiperda granulovirus]AJK91735.1 dbp [Spodoptera frugiperda granulovirus]AXS01097.1 dbp [Spodoptera frugiperda granulovirus]
MSLQLVNNAADSIVAAQNEVVTSLKLVIIDRIKDKKMVFRAKNMLDLHKKLSFQHSCVPVDVIEPSLKIGKNGKLESDIVKVTKKMGPPGICYFFIGHEVEGGLISFFTATTGTARKCKSVHGDFITYEGDDFPIILHTYQKLIAGPVNKPQVLISKVKLLSLGLPNEVGRRQAVMQKFYVADPSDNEEMLCNGELKMEDHVYIRPMTPNEFETLFKIDATKKSSEDVPFLFAMSIKGVTKGVSREEMMLVSGETVNGNNIYTLNATPEIFIYFPQHVAAV